MAALSSDFRETPRAITVEGRGGRAGEAGGSVGSGSRRLAKRVERSRGWLHRRPQQCVSDGNERLLVNFRYRAGRNLIDRSVLCTRLVSSPIDIKWTPVAAAS